MSNNIAGAEIVGDLSETEFKEKLTNAGIGIQIGPFAVRLRVSVDRLYEPLYLLYKYYPLVDGDSVFSLHASLRQVRKYPSFRRLVRFSVDGRMPHEDMPIEQSLAVLEWGLNLVIALRSHNYLMLHSAAIERNGSALLLPAEPGHGKSTICAALAQRGWRLLSDEFGLIRPKTYELDSVPRPIALKNESIDVIRKFEPNSVFGPSIPNTRKGTIAHLRPSISSVQNQATAVKVRWVVFPRWVDRKRLAISKLHQADSFLLLAKNSFNYELLGESAFCALRSLVTTTESYRLEYSDIDECVSYFDDLARDNAGH